MKIVQRFCVNQITDFIKNRDITNQHATGSLRKNGTTDQFRFERKQSECCQIQNTLTPVCVGQTEWISLSPEFYRHATVTSATAEILRFKGTVSFRKAVSSKRDPLSFLAGLVTVTLFRYTERRSLLWEYSKIKGYIVPAKTSQPRRIRVHFKQTAPSHVVASSMQMGCSE